MRRLLAALAAIVVVAFIAAGESVGAEAPPIRVVGLYPEGGEDWRARDKFRLAWEFEGVGTIVAVHVRVRASDGTVIVEQQLRGAPQKIYDVQVDHDGVYLAEVWAESGGGIVGPPATTHLRLDQGRPANATPLVPTGWIAGTQAVHLRLALADGPVPLSGISGYAVSIDTDPDGSPCATELCVDEEIDLRGGASDYLMTVPSLPEGKLYVHAAAVSGAGLPSGQVGTAVALVDATAPRVVLEGVPVGWVAGPVAVRALASDALSGMAASDAAGAFTAIAVDGGPPVIARGATSGTVVSGDGVHRLTAFARDAIGNRSGEQSATATVRIDTGPPRVAFADRRDPEDPDRIDAVVSDGASGVAGRGSIAFRPAGSRQRFEPLPTAANGGRLSARWDPTAHPPGTYELRATGWDLAGNTAASDRRANGSRMLLVNPRRAETRIEASIGRDDAAGGASGSSLRGRLSSANGAPLAGREVGISEDFDSGATSPSRTITVRTAPDGSFTLPLAAGPSRRLRLSFAGDRSFAPAPARALPFQVPSRVKLCASSRRARIGGRPVVFRGRVDRLGAALPRGGLAVALQFRLPGQKWSEFRTVATDAQGHFRYPYVFSDDDSRGIRFQFRALVADQQGWPYAAGTSGVVNVTGQ